MNSWCEIGLEKDDEIMETGLSGLSLTRKLLAFNTINPPGQERECAEYLGGLLKDAGFGVAYYEFAEGRTSLVARMAGSSDKPPICFTGHVDTVPLGDAEWTRDPFSGEVDGDRLFGRGTSDMKSGVAAMVLAAARLADMPKGTAGVTLVITAGEESACRGALHLAELGDVMGEAGALVVGEPTSNYPLVGHKGAMWLKAWTTGVAAHGSMPEKGVNAIYKAAEAVTRLKEFDFGVPAHPILGSPTLNVGTISGGVNINSVPNQAAIGIDIRLVPGQEVGDVIGKLQSHLGEEVELELQIGACSVATDPEDEWVQQVFDIMHPILRERPEPRGATYFTDASALLEPLGNPPTLILGPGEPDMAHKTDEFCYVYKIEQAVETYTEISVKYCGS